MRPVTVNHRQTILKDSGCLPMPCRHECCLELSIEHITGKPVYESEQYGTGDGLLSENLLQADNDVSMNEKMTVNGVNRT